MQLTFEEAITIIDHYRFQTKESWKDSLKGMVRRSSEYSAEQACAIAKDIINNRMGTDWYQSVLDYQELNSLKAKLCSYDVEWINSPYYKYAPKKELPLDFQERVQHLKNQISELESRLANRKQNVGRASRRKKTSKQTLHA